VFATGRLDEFFAKLAEEDIDDFELGLVHPGIEMVEEHLFRYGSPLAKAEQLKDAVLVIG
jgi:hypothetical protein